MGCVQKRASSAPPASAPPCSSHPSIGRRAGWYTAAAAPRAGLSVGCAWSFAHFMYCLLGDFCGEGGCQLEAWASGMGPISVGAVPPRCGIEMLLG